MWPAIVAVVTAIIAVIGYFLYGRTKTIASISENELKARKKLDENATHPFVDEPWNDLMRHD